MIPKRYKALRRDTRNPVIGWYIRLRQVDGDYLHILVDDSGEYHAIDFNTLEDDDDA